MQQKVPNQCISVHFSNLYQTHRDLSPNQGDFCPIHGDLCSTHGTDSKVASLRTLQIKVKLDLKLSLTSLKCSTDYFCINNLFHYIFLLDVGLSYAEKSYLHAFSSENNMKHLLCLGNNGASKETQPRGQRIHGNHNSIFWRNFLSKC